MSPLCILCGQRHEFDIACDVERLAELRERVSKIAQEHAAVGIYHTANTTFVRRAVDYLATKIRR